MAVNEAVNNAFYHGINDNKGSWVTLSMNKNEQDLCIEVSHDGEGFVPEFVDCSVTTEVYNEGGRGIDIIRHYVDSLEFSTCGRKVIMHKKLNTSLM